MGELADPAASQVVLIGAASYEFLGDLPAVAGNVAALDELLGDAGLWGVPRENRHVLLDCADPATVNRTVRTAAAAVGDGGLLLVYFAGHGLVDPMDGSLVLALPGTSPDVPHERGLPYDWIRRTLVGSAAARRIVVLDCCYGGRAAGEMAADASAADAVADRAMIESTCLLVAASANRTASAPPGEPYTAFTGELIRVLRDGLPGDAPNLTVETIWRHVRQALHARGYERPELRERNAGGSIPLVRNAARRVHDLAGSVLVASSSFGDPDLGRSAVLVLRHNSTGAAGIRITRPDGRLPPDFPRPWLRLVSEPASVFDGGPLARDGYIVVTMLRPGAAPPLRFLPIRDRLGTLQLSALPEPIHTAVYGLRVFQGYLGWGPGELEGYLEAGDLVERRSSAQQVLTARPGDLWRRLREGP